MRVHWNVAFDILNVILSASHSGSHGSSHRWYYSYRQICRSTLSEWPLLSNLQEADRFLEQYLSCQVTQKWPQRMAQDKKITILPCLCQPVCSEKISKLFITWSFAWLWNTGLQVSLWIWSLITSRNPLLSYASSLQFGRWSSVEMSGCNVYLLMRLVNPRGHQSF